MHVKQRYSLILALALLLGQWLAFAHGLEHPALSAHADCSACVHVHHLGSAARQAAALLPDFGRFSQEAPQSVLPPFVAVATLRGQPIRGPPGLQA